MPANHYLTPARPRSPIREIKCARGCGFKRPYTDADWYLTRIIDHPYYGLVSGENLVQLEMYNHDCSTFLERQAYARAKIRLADEQRARLR